MAEEARGGAFGGGGNTDAPVATNAAAVTTEESARGSFFTPDNTAVVDQPGLPAGNTDDSARGGFFGGSSDAGLERSDPVPTSFASDESRGGLFGGFSDRGVQIVEGPQGPPGRDGEQGPRGIPGRDGRSGTSGRGIISVRAEPVPGNADQNEFIVLYSDGTEDRFIVDRYQDDPFIAQLASQISALPVDADDQWAVRKTGTDAITLVEVEATGPAPEPTMRYTFVVNFGTANTTATLNGATVIPIISEAAGQIGINNDTIGTNAEVEVNGVTFFAGIDYMITRGAVFFTEYTLQQGDGDLIIITWTEAV